MCVCKLEKEGPPSPLPDITQEEAERRRDLTSRRDPSSFLTLRTGVTHSCVRTVCEESRNVED